MNENFINLRQSRELGDVISATFGFLKNEFVRLGLGYLFFLGPIIVVYSFIYSMFFSSLIGDFQYLTVMKNFDGILALLSKYGIYFICLMLVGLLNYTMMFTYSFAYMKIYVETEGQFTSADVWGEIQRSYFRVMGNQLVLGLIYMVAMPIAILLSMVLIFTLILPFLLIAGFVIIAVMFMSYLLCISVMENAGFGTAMSRTFFLLNGSFWRTFLITFIMSFIIMMLTYLFSLINQLFMGYNMASSLMEGKSHFSVIQSVVFFFVTIIATFFPIVGNHAIAIQYFSAVQDRESPELMDRINEIQ